MLSCCTKRFAEPGAICNDQRNLPKRSISPFSSNVSQTRAICSLEKLTAGKIGGGGGGIGKRPILYIGNKELRGLLEKSAAAAAACCCSREDDTWVLLIVTGGVDDEGVSGLSGVGERERERRDIGDRDRDLDEPDEDALDDIDEDEGDRLIDVFILCEILGEEDDDEDAGGGTRPTFARSGRGAGSKVLSDNVLAVFKEKNEEKNQG